MPATSREKSNPRVSKVFSRISSDPKTSRSHGEAKTEEATRLVHAPPHSAQANSPKAKKVKRGILPYFRGHKNGKKSEKEKEKAQKDKKEENKHCDVSETVYTDSDSQAQLSPVLETPEVVTKETGVVVLPSKEPSESGGVVADVTKKVTEADGGSPDASEESEEGVSLGEVDTCPHLADLDLKTYSLMHSAHESKFDSPLKAYQKSFLHNRYDTCSDVETLPTRFRHAAPDWSNSSVANVSAFRSHTLQPLPALRTQTLQYSAASTSALRSQTLQPSMATSSVLHQQALEHSRATSQDLSDLAACRATALCPQVKSSTLDTVRARFQNHVNNLTYEGMDFTSSEQGSSPSSPTPSSWSLGGRGFTSPFSKLHLYATESLKGAEKEREKKLTRSVSAESKCAAKVGVKKILLHNRLKEDSGRDTSPESVVSVLRSGTTTKVQPVSKNLDSITISSNKFVKAKLNITVVKTPEILRRGRLGSFRFTRTGIRSSARASQRKRRDAGGMPSSTSWLSTSMSSLTSPSTTMPTATTMIDGKTIPEYAKVNKRKNSKPDIVEEKDFNGLVLTTAAHVHESPAEKAPIVKKIEAAAYKARKDSEPSLKVNSVKRSESFKTGSRVGRRSSLTFASRAKMMEGESFVKSQAVKLRRKDSKNGRLDIKNARKAEYRLSVTIKPSTVATLANKFNTIISQNQAGNPITKSELPFSHVAVHKTRVLSSLRASARLKNRHRTGRFDPDNKESNIEGASVMNEKSKKEEKNREERRGDMSVAGARKVNSMGSRSPSPKKSAVPRNLPLVLDKLGDNKTDEEKVCEKIKTALSSGKFKGETDDSEDDVVDKDDESTDEEKYRSRLPSPSPSTAARYATLEEEPYTIPGPSSASVADSVTVSYGDTASNSTIPKTTYSVEKHQTNSTNGKTAKTSDKPIYHLTEKDQHVLTLPGKHTKDQVLPVPEGHAKSDSMDSGISNEEDRLFGARSLDYRSTSLATSSVQGFHSLSPEDSSLDTVISTDTCRSEDSAIALRTTQSMSLESEASIEDLEDKDIEQEKALSKSCSDTEEKGAADILESEEKGIVDLLESESKGTDGGARFVAPFPVDSPTNTVAGPSQTNEHTASAGLTEPEDKILPVDDDLEDVAIEPDSRSVSSSVLDDTHSEVSSVCSDVKSKRTNKANESRIYTAVKSAVKNTVKKTKEKDAERKEERERERRNRSPSADREKWYRRGRSRERGREKKKDDKDQGACDEQRVAGEDGDKNDDDKSDSPKKDGREREGRNYERFTFRRLREKSQERRRNKERAKEEEKKKEVEKKASGEESKKESKSKKKEEKEEGTYGKWSIRSRSRSRDRKKYKDKVSEQLAQEEAEAAREAEELASAKAKDFPKHPDSPQQLSSRTSLTLPYNMRKSENMVFTFDTDSLYDRPQTPSQSMKSMTLPPPPKTPIPSPPSSATTPIPPPPKTPIPALPTESMSDDAKETSNISLISDKSNGDSDSSNETENIYENLYAPNLEKLHRNREKLEGRGIRPNSSFLWSDGGQAPTSSEVSDIRETIQEEAEPERSPFIRLIGVRTYGRMDRYGKITPSGKAKETTPEGHNYAELQQGAEDTQTLAYDDIGAVSAVSYDDIGAPSSCGYDDIRAPSTVGYDTIRPPSEGYDPVNPPRSDSSQYDDCDGGIVTAQFAVVMEDQLDSISYMYDEISMYNASQNSHSYEPVYPPGVAPQGRPAVSSIEEVPEMEGAAPVLDHTHVCDRDDDASSEYSQDGSEGGIHEVFSYKLTRIGGTLESTPVVPSTPTPRAPTTPTTPTLRAPTTPTTPTTPSTPGSTIHTRIYGGSVAAVVGGECGGGEGAPSPSLSPTEGKSETSDEWMDVSDTETDISTSDPITITTQIPLVRMRQRSKRWRPRNWRRSWSQGVRDVAAHTHAHTIGHTHGSTTAARDEIEYCWREVYVSSSSTIVLGQSEPNQYDTAYAPGYYNASLLSGASTSSSLYYESAKIRSIFYDGDENESQEISLYVEGGDSEEEDPTTGHYEAIYEVISPAQEDCFNRADDNDFDSFDSDNSDDDYCRLRPQFSDEHSQISRDQLESINSEVSASDKDQQQSPLQQQQQQQQQQQHGITKIAEAANLGMRRLRRNWSLTKNEVRTGLSRIKKKSTFSVSDMKSTENLACDASPSSASAENKRKWSFKSHFRRKSSSGSVTTVVSSGGPPSKKESATFYLTLTIETGSQDAGDMSDASQRTGRSDSESVLSAASAHEYRKSNTPSVASVTTVGSSESVPLRRPTHITYNRKSSAGSSSYGPVRPRTAPPAPPPKEKSSEVISERNEGDELSKLDVASRLNQLLSCGPVAPPGRRVLRTSECSSSDTSPVPVLIHPEESGHVGLRPNGVKYATIDMSNFGVNSNMCGDSSGDEKSLGAEIANFIKLNIPQARMSVASSASLGSSEGYIRPGDIASAPPPLPARRTPSTSAQNFRSSSCTKLPPMLLNMPSSLMDGDNNSYLDLSCTALIQDEPLYVSSHFADEPLYQFYTATVLERAAHNQGDCSSEDDYEVINDGHNSQARRLQSRPSAMELVTPADGRRTLWCELPEVIDSGLLNQISSQEWKIQEAMFEMITSEASYLKSLNVLVTHFVQCPEFTIDEGEDAVLSRRERHILFSDILPVKRCSELFLADLEKRWQVSVQISTIADIICKHADKYFQVYVKYCSNQIYQDRTLKELKENNPRFLEVLNRLESSPVCQSLAMHSFLMLPMQRITRLPLLVDAIFHRLEYGTHMWNEYKVALATLTKIVAECNEGARKMERMEEMLILSRQLDFREVKAIPLISASRWLVKKGELTRLTWRETDAKLTFGKRISKCTLYFFLFTDLLVVTKKKSEDQYMVLDYCSRNMVQVLELDAADKFPGRILDGHKNLLIMTMLQNHENKTVEMVVSCPMESDRTRWVEAVTPRSSDNPDERIYEEWDCPQVQAVHPYVGKQPDELSLEVSDVVNVLKKMADGWYQGERIRDQERGWFPGSFTVEISSTHVRARNLRQRYRLLAISGSLLDELKKEKERYDKEEKKKDRRRTLTIKEVISSQAQVIS
ncbi:serine-rich adhesin for platelets isoform X2 [Procambarus clarkii]